MEAVNGYDALAPDVERLLAAQESSRGPVATSAIGALASLWERVRLGAMGLSLATGLHRRLIYANLNLGWFREFEAYWREIGGRPLHPIDFVYLAGHYRAKGQDLASWDDPGLVYALFRYHYRIALSPLRVYPFVRWIPRGGRVLEYGCGAAPMLTGLARYYRRLDLRLYGSDLPHLLFHFARWRFRDCPWVKMVPAGEPIHARFDVVFCTEVLEHVPSPLQTVRDLHEMLLPGGVLIYDFAETDGRGLDSPTAQADRPAVKGFMAAHFDVLDRVGGVVVARKL